MALPLHAVDTANTDYTADLGNHFFYLLAEGAVVPTGFGAGTPFNLTPDSLVRNGNTALVGIGHSKACAIWYKALTTHFAAKMPCPLARAAFSGAARDLYGAGSAEDHAVAEAWDALEVS